LVDLWRNTHNDEREWTWLFKKTGNGFRIDHALANTEFVKWAAPICSYDHGTRTKGLTDHSALIVEIPAEAK
jgi:exonuclease III